MKIWYKIKTFFLGPPTGYKTGMIWNKNGQIEERRWPIWDKKWRMK